MKKITTILFLMLVTSFLQVRAQETGTFTDSRDGKTYTTVTIGKQVWMAENLAYKAKQGYCAYNDADSNVSKYGYLYQWKTACSVCPQGWRLPSDEDWKALEIYLGVEADMVDFTGKRGEGIGTLLKSSSGWAMKGNGNNNSGFNALPAGGKIFYNYEFHFIEELAYFWSSTTVDHTAYGRVLRYDDTYINRGAYDQLFSLSVRCVKAK